MEEKFKCNICGKSKIKINMDFRFKHICIDCWDNLIIYNGNTEINKEDIV